MPGAKALLCGEEIQCFPLRYIILLTLQRVDLGCVGGDLGERQDKISKQQHKWLHYLIALCPWGIYLTSLGLSFFICIMGTLIVPSL